MTRMVWLKAILAAAGLVGVASLAVVQLSPEIPGPRVKARKTDCANQLRQIGLASWAYADDTKSYPWADGADGAERARKCLEVLYKLNYIDDPSICICSAGPDTPAAAIDDRDLRKREFHLEPHQCSYVWRNAPIPWDAPKDTPIAADKRGPPNHKEGWNVLFKGVQVEFFDEMRLRDPHDAKARRVRLDLGIGN